ncbi:MAG: arsenate reductase (glutaredoxin) [Verrucomicrobiota bacterium]|jgi:arsenate reductase (glutaredoxin)
MNDFCIYHNPRCSKSRAALLWLNEHGVEPQVIEYLKESLTAQTIEELLAKLGLGVRDILRDSEAEFGALHLADQTKTSRELILAIVDHPILLQRPIVVTGNRAVIARPTEKLAELL